MRSRTGSNDIDEFLDRAKARGCHAAYLRYLNQCVEIAKLPPEQQQAELQKLGATVSAQPLLVRTLAQVLGCSFARIQFTPDLMPTDIIGTNVFNLQRNEFTLIKGPIFTSFLLADEIIRSPANTQSALLQAMQERAVTIDRDTH